MTTVPLAIIARRRRRRRANRLRPVLAILRHLLLAVASLAVLVPIAYMVLASFKSVPDFFSNPYGFPSEWVWQNYLRAWTQAKIAITLPNTVIVTGSAVIGSTFLSVLIAYGISRRERPFAFVFRPEQLSPCYPFQSRSMLAS